jgi:hypothetical protein
MFRPMTPVLPPILIAALTTLLAAPFAGAEDEDDGMDSLQILPEFDADEGQACIQLRQINGTTILGDRAIEFRLRSGERHVNILPAACPSLKPGRTVQYESAQSRLCKGDYIKVLIAFSSGFRSMGRCALGKFHPLPEQMPAADDAADES